LIFKLKVLAYHGPLIFVDRFGSQFRFILQYSHIYIKNEK
jgi:hypothetical protein